MATAKELIERINRLFTENDMEAFMDYLSEDVVWEMHSSSSGHKTLNGKDEVAKMDGSNMPEKINFRFGTIVTEGDVATVEGTGDGTMSDGRAYKSSFCDIATTS